MAKFIDADELVEYLRDRTAVAYPNLYPGLFAAVEYIEEFPTVDAKPVVRGVWLNWQGEHVLPNEFYRWWHCSECNYKMEFDEAITVDQFDSNFCPRCGADMRGAEYGKTQ